MMAVRETTDDGSDPESTPTDLSTGHECPDCGAAVLNGQGRYTCFECDFTLASSDPPAESTFDHPVFRC